MIGSQPAGRFLCSTPDFAGRGLPDSAGRGLPDSAGRVLFYRLGFPAGPPLDVARGALSASRRAQTRARPTDYPVTRQFSPGFSAESTTRTSTIARRASSFSPSCSCNAVTSVGSSPELGAGGGPAGGGPPRAANSLVHLKSKSYCPSSFVSLTTIRLNAVIAG